MLFDREDFVGVLRVLRLFGLLRLFLFATIFLLFATTFLGCLPINTDLCSRN